MCRRYPDRDALEEDESASEAEPARTCCFLPFWDDPAEIV